MDTDRPEENEERAAEMLTHWRRSPGFAPFTRQAAVVIGLGATTVILLLFLWTAAHVLLIVFAGVLLAVLLRGLADRVRAYTSLPAGWSLLTVGLGLLGIIALAIWLIAPQVVTQLHELTETIPQSVDQLKQQVRQYRWGEMLLARSQPENMLSGGSGVVSQVTGIVSSVAGALASAVIVLFVGIYLAINPALYRRGIVKLVPIDKRARAAEVLGMMWHALGRWLLGQFAAMVIVGVMSWLGLMLLGMPLALALGVIAGLLEFVPFIGPVVAAIPALLIAFMEGPQQGLYVALLYLAIQQLEGNLIEPLVMKKAVSLPPVVTVVAAITGGVLFGLPGILLATPLVVVLMVLVQKLYIEDVLRDTGEAAE